MKQDIIDTKSEHTLSDLKSTFFHVGYSFLGKNSLYRKTSADMDDENQEIHDVAKTRRE